MKKMPWGIFAGTFAMLVFFLTVAFIGIYVIFGAIANQTHSDFSAFQNWWQVLIFIGDIISVIGFIGCLSMYISIHKKRKEVAK